MDLRNLASTPSQLESIHRRPSLSSLSSTSGYASSGYGVTTPSLSTVPAGIAAPATSHSAAASAPSSGSSASATPKMNSQRLNHRGFSNASNPNLAAQPNSWIHAASANAQSVSSPSNATIVNDIGPWVEQQKQQQTKVGSLSGDLVDNKAKLEKSDDADTSTADDDDDDDDELIPTAIVIKNIPFAIKKEQLLDVMTKLSLPLPYAFNYHFDNGVFRGLAFANFTSTDETSLVVNQLNGREIGGRKLRVEYKKMLPAQERERIEREKREKRGQLEEQHRSNSNASLASLISATSTTAATKNLSVSGSGAPNSQSERVFLNFPSNANANLSSNLPSDVNFNDVEVLELFSQLIVFRDEVSKSVFELAYPPSLSLNQRKSLTLLCSYLNLLELYDNGLIIIRRKPGSTLSLLSSTATTGNGGEQANSTPSMMNLNQLNNITQSNNLHGSGHPELLRSHSQSALPLPRLRQQTSTPIQQQFPQYQGGNPPSTNGNGNNTNPTNQPRPMYTNIQPFLYQQTSGSQILNNNMNGSSSAAAILRNGSQGGRPYGDIRSTPPLANSFTTHNLTESPTPQHIHHHNTGTGSSTAPGSATGHSFFANSSTSASGKGPSQPTTPLPADINSRFAPFGQHSHLTGSLTSLQGSNNFRAGSEEYTDKFTTLNLYESNGNTKNSGNGGNGVSPNPTTNPGSLNSSTGSSGIWGPK